MVQPRTLVILATYNEINNLPGLVDAIEQVLPHADVLVIDDNSPDGTGRWCDDRTAADSRLKCVHRAGKLGLGTATIVGLRHAIENDYELAVTMDADWSHDPQFLPAIVAATERADVAIGSRYCAGGAIEGWPLHRRLMSSCMNGLTRRMLRLPVRDASGAFRAYRVAALKRINLEDVRATGYAYLEEMLWDLDQAGATFVEIPITFRDRRAGSSKVSLGEAKAKVSTLWRLAHARRSRN
jgi:dolichol-phosphate mannosyltransferase